LTDAILAVGNILEYRPDLDDTILLEENIVFVCLFFLFCFVLRFYIYLRERQREHKWREGQRERDKQTPLLSGEPDRLNPRTLRS